MARTIQHIIQKKRQGEPIVALTAADCLLAGILDQAGVDLVLVGDSLGMVMLGHSTTLPVTLDEMVHHAKAVCRGVQQALVVVDMPFLSYQSSMEQAVLSAGRILKETGAQAVKLEGGQPFMVDTIARLVQIGIPVMGHLGLTPQSIHQVGGFRRQGTTPDAEEVMLQQAIALEKAGIFAIVLEHIPAKLANQLTEHLTIPTIGIGAGGHCDGQILVTTDLLGLSEWYPPFVKPYANLRSLILETVQGFAADVRNHQFPDTLGMHSSAD
ncbi:MAG: 3-methyl-2-oxobutanoate hydroxymethyltransferase [Leptolyngbyaceae bacterium]|nr:3-methyl-2-oxobutanoate hydroxymethyltransferase [Leptolyngbyaceae bacterium]